MAKTTRNIGHSKPVAKVGEAADRREMTTFSIRLSDQQRDQLFQAAALRGWTATALIRTATLEKVAHILNTSLPTKFNFKALGSLVAEQLFKARAVYQETEEGVWEPLATAPPYLDQPPVRVEPDRLSISRLDELDRAARFGGGEFLDMVLESCKALTMAERGDLPDPIDPKRVGES